MAAKLGFEAIKYVFTKALTKKGSQGIARIPGKAHDMRMKQLVDAMATKMRDLGYDVNKVTEKEVKGLLDSAEALAKQKAKEEGLKKFPKETHKFFGKPLKEKDFKEIDVDWELSENNFLLMNDVELYGLDALTKSLNKKHSNGVISLKTKFRLYDKYKKMSEEL